MTAFETPAVVSSESMWRQNFTEAVGAFAVMFDRLPSPLQERREHQQVSEDHRPFLENAA
jgi:hypothetical protein